MKILIYGASDDLVEIDGDVKDEFYLPDSDELIVSLTDPATGENLEVDLGFCTDNPDGWHVTVTSTSSDTPSWPMRFVPRPGDNEGNDPALEVTAPEGTVVTVPGQGRAVRTVVRP